MTSAPELALRSRREALRCFWVLAMLYVASVIGVRAQGPVSPVKVEGSVNLASELYSSEGIEERRPHSAFRAIFAPTIVLFDQVRLPFEIYLTSEDRGVRQPFNQFGVNPQLWGWLTLHAGYFSARISDLTFGDARMLGGGVELQPGNFRFAFLYGRIQQAVDPDSTSGFRGTYDRWAWAAKVGYGAENAFHIHLNIMHAVDDSASLSHAPADVAPMENLSVSLQYGIPFFNNALVLSGELAAAALTNDTRSDEMDAGPSFLKSVFTPRRSSQIDAAGSVALSITPSSFWSVQLNGRWIGPGFVTLGYAQLPNDVLEGTIAPSVRLFNNMLSLRGSLGLRLNNLRSTKLSTTRRTIGNIGMSLQPAPEWGVDVQYANYGMQSNPRNDTLRIDNFSQSFTLSPRYTFNAFNGTSTLLLTYSLQSFTDFNVVTGALSDNKTHTGVLSWIIAWPSALSLTTSLMGMASSTQLLETSVQSATETAGYSFLNNTMTSSVTLGYTVVRTLGSDGQVVARCSLGYTPSNWGTFTLALSTSQYTYDPRSSTPSYRENTGSLQYSYAF